MQNLPSEVTKERIAHGPLFRAQFIALGLALMGIGGALCAIPFGFIVGIPLMVFGLIVAADLESVFIDFKERKVRYYHNFLLFSIHNKTKDISSYKTVSIGYANNLNEGDEYNSPVAVVISFEMHLVKEGYKPFYLTEFGSHKEALGLALRMQEHMDTEVLDLVELAISKAMKRNRR